MSDLDAGRDAMVRASAVIATDRAVLLVHRVGGGRDDWVLPGGLPRSGETLASCARRETLEETGVRIVPNWIAFVLETVSPTSRAVTIDIVFLADRHIIGEPRQCEPGLIPSYLPLADLAALTLRPPIAGHLRNLLTSPTERCAAYLGNLWRPPRPAVKETAP